MLNLSKKSLNSGGKLLIFSLKTKNNKIPGYKDMKQKLIKSLKKDEVLLRMVKKNLYKINETKFHFKVKISKQKYIQMIKNRYISCLLNASNRQLDKGIGEIKMKFGNQIKFTDTLKCISFRK